MAKETTLNEIGEMLAHVVEHMATKDDVRAIVPAEVPGIISRGDKGHLPRTHIHPPRPRALLENLTNVIGYRKEIDHAIKCIAAIEKHLGINKKIVA